MTVMETDYKGYHFRSRLEARWAVYFDALGIKWEYEREGFDLDGVRYLPDFYLHLLGGIWWEVKGNVPTEPEIRKAQLLTTFTKQIVVIAQGTIGEYLPVAVKADGGFFPCAIIPMFESTPSRNDRPIDYGLLLIDGNKHGWILSQSGVFDWDEYGQFGGDIIDAVRVARSARFEYHHS